MSVGRVHAEGTQQLKYLYLYQGVIGVQHYREEVERWERGREREGISVEGTVYKTLYALYRFV